MLKLFMKSLFAGFLISIAGVAYLQCEDKTIGACLFSLGLISVILLEANLFTGKIGYVYSWQTLNTSLVILFGNLVAAAICGSVFRVIYGTQQIMALKLLKSIPVIFWDAFFCGVCIYLAIECFKQYKNIVCIILPVAVFILAKGEHSIADAFYLFASGVSLKGFFYLFIIIIGNAFGSLITRGLQIGI